MVQAAQRQAGADSSPNIKYVQGRGEDLRGVVEADSVDLLISGSRSAHNTRAFFCFCFVSTSP